MIAWCNVLYNAVIMVINSGLNGVSEGLNTSCSVAHLGFARMVNGRLTEW